MYFYQVEEEEKERDEKAALPLGTRRRISDGIQTLMTRLSLGSRGGPEGCQTERQLSPWALDEACNIEEETALHAAVKNNYTEIASLLLSAGANANLHSHTVSYNHYISCYIFVATFNINMMKI